MRKNKKTKNIFQGSTFKNISRLNLGKEKAFTLIELLFVIAIIGIVAAIVIINLSVSAKDKSNQKAAYSAARSAQARLVQCLSTDGWLEACYDATLNQTVNCRGAFNINSLIVAGQPICGGPVGKPLANVSNEKWPYITTQYGYRYDDGSYEGVPCSSLVGTTAGAFNFAIYKNGATNTNDKIFCCTQIGCSEMNIDSNNYVASDYLAGSGCNSAATDFDRTICKCKKQAGLQGLNGVTCN